MKQALLSYGMTLSLLGACAPESSSFRPAAGPGVAAPQADGALQNESDPQGGDGVVEHSPQPPSPEKSHAGAVGLRPTFDSIKDKIFARSCLQCHASGGHVEDIPLDTRAGLLSVPGLAVAGRPDESDLIRVLVPESGARQMPPRRSNLPPVTPEEVEVLREWIRRGMP